MQVIVVPAELTQPCTLRDIPGKEWRATLACLTGAVYDREAIMWAIGDGAGASPANLRATRYAFGHSAASRQHRTGPDRPLYWLYGTVLVTGAATGGKLPQDAPPRLRAFFGIEH